MNEFLTFEAFVQFSKQLTRNNALITRVNEPSDARAFETRSLASKAVDDKVRRDRRDVPNEHDPAPPQMRVERVAWRGAHQSDPRGGADAE
eukprot:29243-Pelagococcus_subviridis.AAC.9